MERSIIAVHSFKTRKGRYKVKKKKNKKSCSHWWPFARQKTLAVNDANVRRILILAKQMRKKRNVRGTVSFVPCIHDKFSDLAEVIYPLRSIRSSVLFVVPRSLSPTTFVPRLVILLAMCTTVEVETCSSYAFPYLLPAKWIEGDGERASEPSLSSAKNSPGRNHVPPLLVKQF